MAKFLDYDGLSHLWSQLKTKFVNKETGKGLSTNDFTDTLKSKLDGISAGATAVTVDSSLSNSSTNPVQNKVINSALAEKASTSVAATNANGLMSSADKTKLNGIAEGATKVIVDTSLSQTSTNAIQNKAVYTALAGKASTSVASAGANGLMSSADYTKLAELPTNATLTQTYATKSELTGLFSFKGSKSSLNSIGTLADQVIGSVYNITEEFTTTADFLEGAGVVYNAGTNIVVVSTESGKKWDALSGLVDVSADVTAITNSEIDIIVAN